MNFGSRSKHRLPVQAPTYRIAPNFTIRPSPNGPLDLNTFVTNIKRCLPLNQGASNRVEIPDGERYYDSKEGVLASLQASSNREANILARCLDRSIGGNASLAGQRSDEDVYEIRKLETKYFCPRETYVQECLELPEVKNYLECTKYDQPVYLITGLKIARGATISTVYARGYEAQANGTVNVSGGPVDAEVGGGLRGAGGSAVVSSFNVPSDFVLGIQLQKYYHEKYFWTKERKLASKPVTKDAVLAGDEELDPEIDPDNALVPVDLDDDEAKGLVL